MKQNVIEIIVGFFVIFVALFFLSYSYISQGKDNKETYILNATFQSVEGVIAGSDVSIGGIIIGKVQSLKLDPITYDAKMVISVDKDVQIPTDSRASIASSGFLGGKYVSITPGGDEAFLKEGDRIKFTQSSINLESLIGKFMYSGGSGQENKNKTEAPSSGSAPVSDKTDEQSSEASPAHVN